MALLMAGKCPEYFKAIGSYVPITDLKQFHDQSEFYRDGLLACCSASSLVLSIYSLNSPRMRLPSAR